MKRDPRDPHPVFETRVRFIEAVVKRDDAVVGDILMKCANGIEAAELILVALPFLEQGAVWWLTSTICDEKE